MLELYLLCELRAIYNRVEWRSKIDGRECDIYLPDQRAGVEIDGEYWHRDKLAQDSAKTQHLSKLGIYLIRVRDSRLPQIEGPCIDFGPGSVSQTTCMKLIRHLASRFENVRRQFPCRS